MVDAKECTITDKEEIPLVIDFVAILVIELCVQCDPFPGEGSADTTKAFRIGTAVYYAFCLTEISSCTGFSFILVPKRFTCLNIGAGPLADIISLYIFPYPEDIGI